MVDRRQIKRRLNSIQKVKIWQLVILLILMAFLAATFLRLNNIGMIERREAVISADEEGDDEVTANRLYDLQRYVTSHMNTDMGKGVYLEASYKRDAQEAYNSASSESNVYKKAQDICEPRYSSWSYAYLQCTLEELEKYPSAQTVKLPVSDNYLHVFVSPLWSPDFAGFSVLICVVIFIMILLRATTVIILKILIKSRYKSI